MKLGASTRSGRGTATILSRTGTFNHGDDKSNATESVRTLAQEYEKHSSQSTFLLSKPRRTIAFR